jgi:hypothetical protein
LSPVVVYSAAVVVAVVVGVAAVAVVGDLLFAVVPLE